MRVKDVLAALTGAPRALLGWRCVARLVFWRRWRICRACSSLTPAGRCNKCGCFMRLKARLPAATCPLGRWGAIGPKSETPPCAGCARARRLSETYRLYGIITVGSAVVATVSRPPAEDE